MCEGKGRQWKEQAVRRRQWWFCAHRKVRTAAVSKQSLATSQVERTAVACVTAHGRPSPDASAPSLEFGEFVSTILGADALGGWAWVGACKVPAGCGGCARLYGYSFTPKKNRRQTPDTRHQTPDTRHQTPDTRHQTPDTRHQTLTRSHTHPQINVQIKRKETGAHTRHMHTCTANTHRPPRHKDTLQKKTPTERRQLHDQQPIHHLPASGGLKFAWHRLTFSRPSTFGSVPPFMWYTNTVRTA